RALVPPLAWRCPHRRAGTPIAMSRFPNPHTLKGQGPMDMQDTAPQKQESGAGTGPKRSLRGFAAMDPQRQREIASLGGRAAHQSGHAHEFTTEEARAAGKKRHAMRRGGSSEGAR